VTPFAKGDLVQLTRNYIAHMNYRGRRQHYKDWTNRTGVVVSANSYRVRLIWDGRKTSSEFPPRALMKKEST
jgi:hypothetical protein